MSENLPKDGKLSNLWSYHFFILFFSILSVLLLAVRSFAKVQGEALAILNIADDAICLIFLFDFLLNLKQAENRKKYLVTWGWIDLLSSIPVIDALRWGRAARVIRFIRIIRNIKASKVIAMELLDRREESAVLSASLLTAMLLLVSSLTILELEVGANINIKTAEDALWWSFVTMTTVGYGDFYPVTTGGRLVAGVLMVCGVGLFALVTGLIANWFFEESEEAEAESMQEMQESLDSLHERLEQMEERQQETLELLRQTRQDSPSN